MSFFLFSVYKKYIKRMTSRWLNYSKTPVSTVIYTTGNSTIDSNLTAGDGILISDTGVISNVLTVRDGELSQFNLSKTVC